MQLFISGATCIWWPEEQLQLYPTAVSTHVWLHSPLFDTAHSLISKTKPYTEEQYSKHKNDSPSDTWRVIDFDFKSDCWIVVGNGDPQVIEDMPLFMTVFAWDIKI